MVDLVLQDEYFEVRFASVLSSYDRQIITDLYEPLVGYGALALFFTLWAIGERKDLTNFYSHKSVFIKMQIGTLEFLKARQTLEGIGLLKTYAKTQNDSSMYIYELYAPKYPNNFFSDVLCRGLLIKYVGEKEANRLMMSYQAKEKDESYKDISSSFGKAFHPDFDDASFATPLKEVDLEGRKSSKVDTEFDFSKFFDYVLEKGMLRKDAFTKKQLEEISRLSALYGVNEFSVAESVLLYYHPENDKENRIDFDKVNNALMEEIKYPILTKKNSVTPLNNLGSSVLASKVKMMSQLSCKDYLRIKQNNTQPTIVDLKLCDDLSKTLSLNPATINAIIDFVLEKNNNILARSYTMKIAASIAREGIDNPIDAMNYLKKVNRAFKNAKTYKTRSSANSESVPTKENETSKKEEMSDEELDDILKML